LVEELEGVTSQIFRRMMEEADGAPIWVPLSGGLDSRLVLCKFKQLGYDHLHAFSYGPPFNHEAKWAKQVAERLGRAGVLPWYKRPQVRFDFERMAWSLA
jgi:asparagine synthase (glutamine-hydrolysing)